MKIQINTNDESMSILPKIVHFEEKKDLTFSFV
jgi:hypothetical protein